MGYTVPELLGLVSGGTADGGADYGTAAQEPLRATGPASRHPLQAENSVILTACILIACMVGTGVLSLGFAVAKLGWLLGPSVLLAMLCMSAHTVMLLWRLRMAFPSACTYADLASAVFAHAPAWQRRLAVGLTLGAQQSELLFSLSVACLSVGKGLGMLFYDELRVCFPLLVVLALVSFSPVQVSARYLGKYYSLMVLNILMLLGAVFIPLVHMAFSGVESTRSPASTVQAFADSSALSMLSGLLVMSFALSTQNTLVEVIAEMREPAQFPRAFMLSSGFAVMLYIAAGVGSYYFAGSTVNSMIGSDLPFGPTFRTAAACVLVHMLITVLTKGTVFCRFAYQVWNPSGLNDTSWHGWVGWCTTVEVCMGLCWLVGQIVPFFSDLISLISATLIPLVAYIIPITLYVEWVYKGSGKDTTIGALEKTALVLELLLAAVFVVFGTYEAVTTLWTNWHTYGMPLACHCENLWATCKCSAHHAGMESCLAET